MKRIINIIIALLAFFAFAPISFAQTTLTKAEKDRIYYKDSGKGIAYSKTITPPDPTGVYRIYLESFVTGEVKMEYKDAPADIILVLDVSTSMSDQRGPKTLVTEQTALSFNKVNENNYLFHYDRNDKPRGYKEISAQEYNGRYYLYVASYGANSQHYHYLRQAANGTISYVNTTSLVPPTGNNGASYAETPDGTIVTFSGTDDDDQALYTGSSRMKDLKNAVVSFIDEVNNNDLNGKDEEGHVYPRDNRLGNRISIITFAGDGDEKTIFPLTRLDETATTIDDMKSDVMGMVMSQGTYPGPGFRLANNQLSSIDATRKKNSSRTIVFFTDGEPAGGQANAAIGQSYVSKTTHTAIVYSVALFDESPDGENLRFLHRVSSDYPNATSNNIGDEGTGGSDDRGYYKDASQGADLTEIFRKIAQESGGSGNTSLGSAVSTVDVVSASFVLPEGASDNIHIYTAPVIGIQEGISQTDTTYTVTVDGKAVTRHWLKFGDMTEIDDSNDQYEELDENGKRKENPVVWVDVDKDITFTLTPTDKPNKVTVEGFDYSGNWCGQFLDENGNPYVDDVTGSSFHGHKVIIEIPILMSPDAVGGPHVETNAPGSGIYVNKEADKPLVTFDSPDVSLPVNIWIQKNNMDEGESAKFTILRALAPASDDSAWEEVTSVFVTKSQGQTNSPVTKVMGLPSTNDAGQEFVYKIKEEGWSWSYTPDKESVLSTDIITNPFIFSNEKKTDIDYKVRHAESKATNVFKTGVTTNPKYDDSKPRKVATE